MADGVGAVRVEERLRVTIGEAKNLQPRSHSSVGCRDVYCSIGLDREEIFRTPTSEKTLNPYFGEEFQFEVPRKFRFLSLYIYDRDKSVKQDKALGKVAIKKEDLPKYHGKDHWFPLVPVDADSEVQGKVHIEVRIDQCIKNTSSGIPSLRLMIRLIECNDLAIINGSCDPYATLTLVYSTAKQEFKRTKIRKKTISPHFDETFYFEVPGKGHTYEKHSYNIIEEDVTNTELRIALWHDSGGVSGSVFLGEVKIPLQGLDLCHGHEAWYFLQPRNSAKSAAKCNLGTLRLKIHYISDHVFSSDFYDPIRNLILQSPDIKPVTSSAAYLLGEISSNKIDAAQPLIRVFMHHGKIVPFFRALAAYEISKVTDANTVFRGNTLVSKCMDEFMKLAGHHYLQDTLKATIDQVFTEHKPCEIDPTRLRDGDSLETNMANLREYIDRILKSITNSALVCPPIMREIFSELRGLAAVYFPDCKEVRYSVVSGFVFLRFFAPAILGPKLFELSSEQVGLQTNRTLTLISKTVQSLGNLVSSKSCQNIFKEDYMVSMCKDFITDQHVRAIRNFLEIISSSSVTPTTICSPIMLKEGVMIKRAQGRKKFGIKNFKKRYFCLTTHELTYSKTKGDSPLCHIPVDMILAVEKLQEESFKIKNMFQVIQNQRALYIQANNCVELKEWIDILTKVCQTNKNRLNEYHPCAFISGQWLCCKAPCESARGCCPVSSGVPADIKVNIDSDREIQRIHTLFLANIDKLKDLMCACESQAVYTGDEPCDVPGHVIEDTKTCFKTLSVILNSVIKLEQDHKQYQSNMYRLTKYGSEQAPIGDNNYLIMAAKNSIQ